MKLSTCQLMLPYIGCHSVFEHHLKDSIECWVVNHMARPPSEVIEYKYVQASCRTLETFSAILQLLGGL